MISKGKPLPCEGSAHDANSWNHWENLVGPIAIWGRLFPEGSRLEVHLNRRALLPLFTEARR